MTRDDRMKSMLTELRTHDTVLGASDPSLSVAVGVVLALLIGAVIGLRMRQQHARRQES